MSRMKQGKVVLAGMLAAVLLAAPVNAQESAVPEAGIRISSYKGDTLPVGVRSGLVIGPSKDAVQTVTSSNPSVVTIENVLDFWVAVTQAEGVATITATDGNGETASVTLTVENSTETTSPASTEVPSLSGNTDIDLMSSMENAEIRLEMDTAQEHAARQYTTHRRKEECETASAHGYLHGFACNLTAFTNAAPDEIAQRAARNWRNSPGHFRVMIDPDNVDVGVGVVTVDGWTYCYLFLGEPGSYNPYA